MTKNELRDFLNSISFRELTLTVDLVATLGILYFYLTRLIAATPEMQADAGFVSSLLLKAIVFSIVVAIASRILLQVVSDGELEQPLDEREKLIDLFGNKHALWVLQAGVCIAIFQYTAEAQNWLPAKGHQLPFLALHIMVVSFIVSEAVNYIMQLVKGRMSAVYG